MSTARERAEADIAEWRRRELEYPLWLVSNGFQRGGMISTIVRAANEDEAMAFVRDEEIFVDHGGAAALRVEPFKLGQVIDVA